MRGSTQLSAKSARTRRTWLALATCVCALTGSTGASAHPAGFTSVNRYLGVECDAGGRIRLALLLDFAEMPSYSEIELLDANHDDTVTPDEQRSYLDGRLPPLLDKWTIEIDGVRATTQATASRLEISPGERGLSTLRIVAEVASERPLPLEASARGDVRVHVRDPTFSESPGWREIAGADSAGATVTSGFKEPPTDALAYSSGKGRTPRVDDAWFTFRLEAKENGRGASTPSVSPVLVDPRLAHLSRAMSRASGSWAFSLVALALAVALGAAHALSPGHGKTLAGAYLVGRRARARQAVLFGTTVTVAHTIVVFAVGGLAVTIERTIGSGRLLRGLEVVSALTVLALGATQLSRGWRAVTSGRGSHLHSPARAADDEPSIRSIVALGSSSGLTPCPSALAILLTAIAIHRYGFGLVLVLAFSMGVAMTLTATGLLVITARRMLDGVPRAQPFLEWLPVLSSFCVLLVGVLLCARTLAP
ncbi:MAG: sulfite exporter TauE/SafE family protein [Myxococcota bacterium]|nr:sulfite exporter TauE/SafE family protein [Myxococcota bacterium]